MFKLENSKISVFNDLDNVEKKILIYNVLVAEGERADISQVYHTICINRKKESNTLYTINSLNKIVEQETGRIDPRHQIDWSKYRDMFITCDKNFNEIVLIRTELDFVVDKMTFFNTQPKVQKAQTLKLNPNSIQDTEEVDDNFYNRI